VTQKLPFSLVTSLDRHIDESWVLPSFERIQQLRRELELELARHPLKQLTNGFADGERGEAANFHFFFKALA
jgi:hypothetical protein